MSELSTLIAALASVVSAFAAWRMWKVSESTHSLQASVERARKPLVNLWWNGLILQAPKQIGSMSVVNTGATALLIRTLRILGPNGQAISFLFSQREERKHPTEEILGNIDDLQNYAQVATDLVIQPNEIYRVLFPAYSSQFKIEAMYYDNTFEFIEIDTSNLGGKYILTGQGRK
jgi:hypothetical protein